MLFQKMKPFINKLKLLVQKEKNYQKIIKINIAKLFI